MHASAYAFASKALTDEDVGGKRVIETGAYNYNGSVRAVVEGMCPASYIGTDVQPGPGVDVVCPAENLPQVAGPGCADVIVSTEMLEHAHDWRAAMAGMVTALAPGGLLLLTCRGPGFPFHPHPGDFWRFTLAQMDAICDACGLGVLRLEADDPGQPGVLLLARKLPGWDETGMLAGLAVIEPGPPQ